MSGKSPTSRALAECLNRGWTAQVVEKWNPFARIRQDLFGCIDIVAITDRRILGIQVTSGANHAARKTKAWNHPDIQTWMKHADFAVWSYSKKGQRGKRKAWTLREEVL